MAGPSPVVAAGARHARRGRACWRAMAIRTHIEGDLLALHLQC